MSYAQWANFVNYNTNDIVNYLGILYTAIQANTNEIPSGLSSWALVPAAGGVSSLIGGTGALTISVPTGGSAILTGQDIELSIDPPPVYQATYFKTAVQNLTSGNTDITFDGEASWNNANGYITHTNGTEDFTVVQMGLYQLEFNTLVLINNGIYSAATNKGVSIDIERTPTAEQAILSNTSSQANNLNYAQSISGRVYLNVGDIINLRIANTFAGGTPTPPQAQCVQNTIDLNTFFAWTYISP
jgi:hypothetical protein